MKHFTGTITVGDWELASKVEGALEPLGGREGCYRGRILAQEALARAMDHPSSLFLLRTTSGLQLNIVMEKWIPFEDRAVVEFTGETYPPIRPETLRFDRGSGPSRRHDNSLDGHSFGRDSIGELS